MGIKTGCQYILPETCGQDIDVPLRTSEALSLVCHALMMSTPGAKISIQFPKLEKDARVSVLSVAPTVIACEGGNFTR